MESNRHYICVGRVVSSSVSSPAFRRAFRSAVGETRRVSIRLTRPTQADLRLLAKAGESDPLTYEPIGISGLSEAAAGYRLDRWSRTLGTSNSVFHNATQALRTWQVHRGAGLIVCDDGPPVVDTVVAMAAPLPIGFIEVVCRVVAVVDEPDRFGFSYGTLRVHPEQGEESFTVVRRADGTVAFEIAAASRPRHVLARAFPPVARLLQRSATTRYLDAMSAAASPDD